MDVDVDVDVDAGVGVDVGVGVGVGVDVDVDVDIDIERLVPLHTCATLRLFNKDIHKITLNSPNILNNLNKYLIASVARFLKGQYYEMHMCEINI